MEMRPPQNLRDQPQLPAKLLNKTFYRFLFSFIAVLAGTLLFILVLGMSSSGVQ
jgi:hypothetical protein